ncbi:hypothetical protein [Aquabacterium sp.]|uniref:hypothetical protein n=1 Tax=Aquabacterium sp. TaxID=1872578 RepID=UPI0040381D37
MIHLHERLILLPLDTSYFVRRRLVEYYEVLCAAIETGSRQQRRNAQKVLSRQSCLLDHFRAGAVMGAVRKKLDQLCGPQHRRFLELARTADRRILGALSDSLWWSYGFHLPSRLLSGDRRVALRLNEHIDALKRNLCIGARQAAIYGLGLILLFVGFFCAAKVDGRNTP